LPRLKRVLMVDSLAAVWGGACGASSVTTYIESAAGVSEGGKTGYTSIVVSVMFLLALFFTPLFGIVPAVATAPALVMVGFLMIGGISEIDFKKADEAIPAFLVLLLIPLTESISTGIGTGFIVYVLLQVLMGKARQTPLILYILAVLFLVSFVLQ
jgi:AGZA family xanthine/uracil permease-like MFS transporter